VHAVLSLNSPATEHRAFHVVLARLKPIPLDTLVFALAAHATADEETDADGRASSG